MSYRGLITLKSLDEPNKSPVDLLFRLSEDFVSHSKYLADQCACYTNIDHAEAWLKAQSDCRAVLSFRNEDERRQWLKTWVEEWYIVEWHGYRAKIQREDAFA